MQTHDDNRVSQTIEPAALSEREASNFLSISPRLLRQLIDKGQITPIHIPGIRRILFDVQDLRAVLAGWKQNHKTPQ